MSGFESGRYFESGCELGRNFERDWEDTPKMHQDVKSWPHIAQDGSGGILIILLDTEIWTPNRVTVGPIRFTAHIASKTKFHGNFKAMIGQDGPDGRQHGLKLGLRNLSKPL